jgi:[lysine-biosynthesis-protein LysW]--L-2-aminoadipate ligase
VGIDDRELVCNLHKNPYDLDVVIERCVNHSRAIHSIRVFEDFGIPTVNTYQVAEVCGSSS